MAQENTQVRSPWLILAFLCIPVFVGSLDLTIISAILPEVLVSLRLPVDTRLDDASWMVTGYLLAYTISMTFTGRLSDLLGRRAVYVTFLGIFMLGSWFVTIAHTWPTELYLDIFRDMNPDARPPSEELRTLHMIILGRVIQAIGAGAMAPVTMALVADLFPASKRTRPIGVVGAIDTVGWVLGHLYGGAMVRFLGTYEENIRDALGSLGITVNAIDWRTLFIINLFLGVFTMAAVIISLRGLKLQRTKARFDYVGTLLIMLALVTLTFGLGGANPESIGSTASSLADEESAAIIWEYIGLAGLFFLLFIVVESRVKSPLINLRMFTQRNVSAASFANICVGFSLTIGLVTLPLLVNFRAESASVSVIQEAALTAGVLLSALTVPMAIAAIPGAILTNQYGYRFTTVTGTALATMGFVVCSLTWETDTSYWLMGLQISVIGVGLGLTISPIAAAVINAAQNIDRGAASAMVLALRLIGMTVALSSLTKFSIDRVNRLVAEEATDITDIDALYLVRIVDVVNELFLLGAAVSLAALLAALWMRGGSESELAAQEQTPTETRPYTIREDRPQRIWSEGTLLK